MGVVARRVWTLASMAWGLGTTGALAATTGPSVTCQPQTVGGVQVCAVDMAQYAKNPTTGANVCPASVTTTGAAPVCEESFAAAMADAALFFRNPATAAQTYLITIGAGSYDFSREKPLSIGGGGAININDIVPAGTGCLAGTPAATGIVQLSGSGCLVISGSGAGKTTLTTAPWITGILGRNVSHLLIENMTMVQPNRSNSQGTFVSEGNVTVKGINFPTLTLDIARGFPTPLQLFQVSCVLNSHQACVSATTTHARNVVYMRAYTNSASPQLLQSTSKADSNVQDDFGYPRLTATTSAPVPPVQPDAATQPNRWTITLGSSVRAVPSYYSQSTGGVPNLICMKIDDVNAFLFNDLGTGGSDIIMNGMQWIGAARGTFRGVSASRTGTGLGAQVYNSSIVRGPAVYGSVPCLSTQSGGMQFGQPRDPPIYGNVVYGLKAVATGDDSIAMFNDIGGTPMPGGGLYPQSVIAQSDIADSFARDINLYNNPRLTGLKGKSPVQVDTATRANISNHGGCDPVVWGTCPVTYTH